jgi:NADPH:quinone reductase-like Zn-dependent oxidoreductase
MVLEQQRQPLRPAELPEPEPGPGQVQLEVRACGVCRTDLHILDGELAEPKLPLPDPAFATQQGAKLMQFGFRVVGRCPTSQGGMP